MNERYERTSRLAEHMAVHPPMPGNPVPAKIIRTYIAATMFGPYEIVIVLDLDDDPNYRL